MQDQKRFFISLAAALGLVVASAGAYAVFHGQDSAYDEAEADADLLDDLDTFPTLKKGDRQSPHHADAEPTTPNADADAAKSPLQASVPIESTVPADSTVVMTQRRSAFRPTPAPEPVLPSAVPAADGPQLAYANPTVPPVSPDEPFRAIDRAPEPPADALDDSAATPIDEALTPPPLPTDALPVPRPRPADVPKLAALDPTEFTPIEVPLPRRKPAVPKVELVATAPGPMNLGQVPVEPVKPLVATPAPAVAAPATSTVLALAPNPAPKAPGSLVALPPRGQAVAPTGPTTLPSSPAEAARRERVIIPPGGEEPPGLRPNRPVLASLTPPDTDAGQSPPVILRTPFGTPFVLQTSSVDMSCAPPKLVGLLRTIEKRYGKKVVVTSGNRTRGRRGSLHMRCMAADIIVPGVDADDLARYARTIPGIGGVGRYCHGNMIHVDIGRPREWKYGCGSYFVARDGTGGKWGNVPQEARGDD